MSFLKSVQAARARLLESATPCDNRDTATPDDAPALASVAMSQVSQQGAVPGDAEAERWRDLFEERAAIREHDAGLSRAAAEAAALDDLARRWRTENPLPASDGTACAHCGKRGPDTPVLACGGHAWLHKPCWVAMDEARQQEAMSTVQALLGASS
jgi:hypothetical protein